MGKLKSERQYLCNNIIIHVKNPLKIFYKHRRKYLYKNF